MVREGTCRGQRTSCEVNSLPLPCESQGSKVRSQAGQQEHHLQSYLPGLCLLLETWSHAILDGTELAMHLRMTLNFKSSCLQVLKQVCTQMPGSLPYLSVQP